jgi:hypothetical protein
LLANQKEPSTQKMVTAMYMHSDRNSDNVMLHLAGCCA